MKARRLPELTCASCKRAVMKAAAVKINGGYYHPFGCVDVALAKLKSQLTFAMKGLR